MESDWKKFREMIPIWRERYLTGRNARLVAILSDTKKSETDRFWEAEELIHREAKTLRRCLDDYSRSTMLFRLMDMKTAGMIRREDLAGFSTDLQKQLFDDPFSSKG